MSKTKFRTWFPEYGEMLDDAETTEGLDHEDAAENAAEFYYQHNGPSIPSGDWEVAVLGPEESEPRMFNIAIDWSPSFHAREKKTTE